MSTLLLTYKSNTSLYDLQNKISGGQDCKLRII